MNRSKIVRTALPVLLFTLTGFLVMGYHPGIEDDGVYLAAIKADLNPALFPHDANFFRLQLQATVFDEFVARLCTWSHLQVGWVSLFLQLLALATILCAARAILCRLFSDERAVWGGVALLSALLTIPVAGTALYIADQHLHPRILATALTLLAIERLLSTRRWMAIPILLVGFLFHPIMGALGASLCLFIYLSQRDWKLLRMNAASTTFAVAAPLSWIFAPPTQIWRQAVSTRTCYFLSRWEWYEWLGAIAPLAMFFALWWVAKRRGEEKLSRFAFAIFAFALFQQLVAFAVLLPPQLERLMPMQPMRYLQLVYVFLFLLGGALIGKYLLARRFWAWAVFLLVVNLGMFASQKLSFADSAHIELPGVESGNEWLQAFAWIRSNTPTAAYFAVDPKYLDAPGNDTHCFRPLAERSVLADANKDTSVVTQVPDLGPEWLRETEAQKGWKHFGLSDFERLKREFRVDWVLVNLSQSAGLDCQWHGATLAVCRVP